MKKKIKTSFLKILSNIQTYPLDFIKKEFIDSVIFKDDDEINKIKTINKLKEIKTKDELVKYIFNFILVGQGLKVKR